MGLVLGTLAGYGRMSRRIVPNQLATLYVEFIRGTPLLVLEITSKASGPALEKPGYYYDGNVMKIVSSRFLREAMIPISNRFLDEATGDATLLSVTPLNWLVVISLGSGKFDWP